MAPPKVDLTEFPVVYITFLPALTLEDITQHETTFTRLFEERGPFLTIADLDTLEQKDLTSVHRRMIADSANRLSQRGAFIAEFVLASSAILRGVFTAYSWLRRSKHPLKAFSTREAASAEARRMLAAPPSAKAG